MEKEFVPYQESLELKELGFNEPCFGVYGYNKLSNSVPDELIDKTVLTFIQDIIENEEFKCVNPKYNRTTANNFIWKEKKFMGNMKTVLKIIAFPVILVISVIEAYITTTIKWFEQFKKK